MRVLQAKKLEGINFLMATRKLGGEELGRTGELDVKKRHALSGAPLHRIGCTLAKTKAVSQVTVGCEESSWSSEASAASCFRRTPWQTVTSQCDPCQDGPRAPFCGGVTQNPQFFRAFTDRAARASRWRCGPAGFELCANLTFSDESTGSQAVPPIAL